MCGILDFQKFFLIFSFFPLVVIFSQKKITLLSQIALKNIEYSPEKTTSFQTLSNIRKREVTAHYHTDRA